MSRPKEIHTIVVLLLLLSALPLSATLVNPFEDELRKSVMALDHARYRAVHDLDQKKQSAGLEAAEQQDYEKFIMYLTVRISEYCQQLTAEQGEAATTGLPCPTGNQALLDRQDATTPTSKEEVAELEKLLSESLGQFDEDLLKEEEQIATRRPKDRETGYGYGSSGGGGGAAGGETGTGEAAMQAPGSSQESADEGIADQGSEGGGKDSPQTGKETGGSASGMGAGVAAGKESGQGTGSEKTQAEGSQSGPREFETGYDDIVARQLREAAEKETDPELKKKLWEEYRKYKEGVH